MPKYLPYVDCKKKMENIRMKHDLGKTPAEIAEELGISRAQVSYYLHKMGLSRPKSDPKGKVPMCIVCKKNPASSTLRYVCGEYECTSVLMSAAACSESILAYVDGHLTKVDSMGKIYYDIRHRTDTRFPMTSEVCVADGVTRVYASVRDHILYHAYKRDGKRRPPTMLWRDQDKWHMFRERRREEEWSRRNMNSEHPQPRRIRGNIA